MAYAVFLCAIHLAKRHVISVGLEHRVVPVPLVAPRGPYHTPIDLSRKNLIMTGSGQLIEVQMSAEGATFSRAQMDNLMDLAQKGVAELVEAQNAAVNA